MEPVADAFLSERYTIQTLLPFSFWKNDTTLKTKVSLFPQSTTHAKPQRLRFHAPSITMSHSYAKENDARAPDETTALLARQESTPERLENGRPAVRFLEHSKSSLPAVDNLPHGIHTTGRMPLGASTGLGGASNAPAVEPARRQRRRLHKESVSKNHEPAANAANGTVGEIRILTRE
jgi:hypothetical protein